MIQPFQNINLLPQIVQFFLSFTSVCKNGLNYISSDLLFGDKLQGNNLSTSFSAAFVYFTEGTLSDRVQNMILVHIYYNFYNLNFQNAFN